MKDKTVSITGSTDGIGKQTSLELAVMGARVIIHGRDPERGKNTVREIMERSGNKEILFSMGGAPVTEGSKTSVFLASDPELDEVSGKFFIDNEACSSSPASYDKKIRKTLWDVSLGIIKQ